MESFAGFERLTDDYADDEGKFHHLVRKANANDLKRKKLVQGDFNFFEKTKRYHTSITD